MKRKKKPFLFRKGQLFYGRRTEKIYFKESCKELNDTIETIFEGLKKQVFASVKNKILEKELTERLEPMVLNAVYFGQEKKIEDFKKKTKA